MQKPPHGHPLPTRRKVMAENEEKLIDLIRNSKDPEKALITAVNIIVDFLKNSKNVDNPSEV